MDCDNWKHRSKGMRCATCISFVAKVVERVQLEVRVDYSGTAGTSALTTPVSPARLGRGRKHATTLNGWPVVWESDWCGDHKLDEEKL